MKEQQAYQSAFNLLKAGRYDQAAKSFRQFLSDYPTSKFADNAQYWLGEAYYDRKLYEKALVEFRRVVTRYPRGNKVPDALLKIGYSYTSLKQLGKARQAFKQLKTVYPKGRPAELASAQLAKLKQAN